MFILIRPSPLSPELWETDNVVYTSLREAALAASPGDRVREVGADLTAQADIIREADEIEAEAETFAYQAHIRLERARDYKPTE